MWGISWLAANQLAAEEGLCTVEWVSKGGRCVGLTTLPPPVPLSFNLGTLTSWNPLGHSRSVKGLIYLYLYQCTLRDSVSEYSFFINFYFFKLIVTNLVKKFLASHVNTIFFNHVNMVKKTSTFSHNIAFKLNLIKLSHLRLSTPRVSLNSGIPIKMLCAILFYLIPATHPIVLFFFNIIFFLDLTPRSS